MRTFEDVKVALKNYHDELAIEAGSRHPHFVVVGGNMCIIKKGAAQYTLGKGDPIPMREDTAQGKLLQFREKCGDNIKLEIISYSDWLNANIQECEHLISCMQASLSGEEVVTPKEKPEIIHKDTSTPYVNEPVNPSGRFISIACPECPYGVNTCMTCKFAEGVNMQVIPWTIICNAIASAEK